VAKPTSVRTTLERLKALPWVVILQVGVVVGNRWRALSEKDRARIASLVRRSRGRPGNLSAKERNELSKLLQRLDLKGLTGELVGLARGSRKRGKRR
jgi:hypothetical protein